MTNTDTSTDTSPKTKSPKKKGPIRTEAVVPFFIVVALTYVYFHFFFDGHLKRALEFGGYHLLGAEVDIAKLETSFFRGTLRIQGIQMTNAEKPTHNMAEIGDIRFGVLWDGLLRARFIVNEMAVEQIAVDTPRKSPGRVKPPDPDKGDSQESAIDKLKNKTLEKVGSKYESNVLGDIAAILGGTSGENQLAKIEGSLPSKARLKDLETEYQAKTKAWQDKLNALPKAQEIQALNERLSKVKTKDFKTPQELQASLQEIDQVLKEADAKYKQTQSAGNDLSSDLNALDQGLKELDAMVRKDIKDLEARFRIPSLDPKTLSKSIFYPYLAPYLAKFNRYKEVAEKYIPPNLMKKEEPSEVAEIQPRPRADGVTYEFTNKKSYPLFWIKRVSVRSRANPAVPQSGDLSGLITDITSHQALIGKPTVAKLEGDFPGIQVSDFFGELTLDNTKPVSRVGYDFRVGSYPLDGRELLKTPDVQVAFAKAVGSLTSKGELMGLKDFKFDLTNQFRNVDFKVTSQNSTAQEILQSVFSALPAVSLEAFGGGTLPGISLNLNSNLGPELARGFEQQMQRKLVEARAKLQAYVDEQVGNEKARFEAEFNKAKSQIESEVKKVQDQLNAEKAKAEAKVTQAKKDAENQARKSAENEAKKALGGPDAEKKLNDLKKRLGF